MVLSMNQIMPIKTLWPGQSKRTPPWRTRFHALPARDHMRVTQALTWSWPGTKLSASNRTIRRLGIAIDTCCSTTSTPLLYSSRQTVLSPCVNIKSDPLSQIYTYTVTRRMRQVPRQDKNNSQANSITSLEKHHLPYHGKGEGASGGDYCQDVRYHRHLPLPLANSSSHRWGSKDRPNARPAARARGSGDPGSIKIQGPDSTSRVQPQSTHSLCESTARLHIPIIFKLRSLLGQTQA